jgi:hypothetical protein
MDVLQPKQTCTLAKNIRITRKARGALWPCIHIYLGIQHRSFIHITSMCPLFNDIHSSSNHFLSTFIHFPSTFSYTFIHDYLLGCHQQCSSTLFYPHPQFIYFSSTFHPHYPTFMHVHELLYNTPILPYIL